LSSSGAEIVRNPERPELGAVEVYINDELIFSKLKNGGFFPNKGIIEKRFKKYCDGKKSSYYCRNSPAKRVSNSEIETEE